MSVLLLEKKDQHWRNFRVWAIFVLFFCRNAKPAKKLTFCQQTSTRAQKIPMTEVASHLKWLLAQASFHSPSKWASFFHFQLQKIQWNWHSNVETPLRVLHQHSPVDNQTFLSNQRKNRHQRDRCAVLQQRQNNHHHLWGKKLTLFCWPPNQYGGTYRSPLSDIYFRFCPNNMTLSIHYQCRGCWIRSNTPQIIFIQWSLWWLIFCPRKMMFRVNVFTDFWRTDQWIFSRHWFCQMWTCPQHQHVQNADCSFEENLCVGQDQGESETCEQRV